MPSFSRSGRRLRILHALSTHEFAGTERYVAQLSALQAASHDVTLLLEAVTRDSRTGGDITPYLAPSVHVVRAGKIGYLARLASLWRSGRFDILHTHLGRASARASWLRWSGLEGKAPLVATLHTSYRSRSYSAHDGLICIADWQKAALPHRQQAKAIVVRNWTTPVSLSFEERAALRRQRRQELGVADTMFVVAAAGRMVPEKRFCLLLKAWRQSGLGHDGCVLALIGDGPERTALEALAQGVPGVRFLGYRADMPMLLVAFDGFVLPSCCEPFGLVLLEAMGLGLPVCATAAGGALDILARAPDSLVPPDCLSSLVAALHRLRHQKPQAWNMTDWYPETRIRRIEAFYERLCAPS